MTDTFSPRPSSQQGQGSAVGRELLDELLWELLDDELLDDELLDEELLEEELLDEGLLKDELLDELLGEELLEEELLGELLDELDELTGMTVPYSEMIKAIPVLPPFLSRKRLGAQTQLALSRG